MVVFAVTGFGEFHGVKENPSGFLVSSLADYLQSNPIPNCNLVSSEVIEVSMQGSVGAVQDMKQKCEGVNDRPIIWVHFGVNTQQTGFRLEKVAWNQADFRCPDQRGYQPVDQPIVAENKEPSLSCCIDLRGAGEALLERGFPVELSTDPGRFICNYIYYQSLNMCNSCRGIQSLFVHIPPFTAVPCEQQFTFIRALLEVLPLYCATPSLEG